MARSLRDLIDFLLAEISLCGERDGQLTGALLSAVSATRILFGLGRRRPRGEEYKPADTHTGASPADVLSFIDNFYVPSPQQSHLHAQHDGVARRTPNVDHRFKQKAWLWLTRHPEVSVGKNKEGNSLALDEVEARYAQVSAGEQQSCNTPTASPPDDPVHVDPQISGSILAKGIPPNSSGALRVFVSEERMWLAITGHERDHSRVPPLEFDLLSIIASRKWQGVMQPELPKLSGQDKRSVPKRTDSLSRKGYIEKRPVQYMSARTSLCTLRKFVRSKSSGNIVGLPVENVDSVPPELSTVIDFPVLLERLFQCLKEFNVITRIDLKAKLGMDGRWRGRVLGRAIRKLERIGCIRRVRAVSQYSDMMRTRHPSVMLIRDLTENDLRLFLEDSRSLVTYLEQEDMDAVEMDQDQGQQDTVDGIPEIKRDIASPPEVQYFEQMGRVVPRWIPDRTLPNMIFDIVDKSGREGSTNHDITNSCMGAFYRRPTESLMSRLVETWQLSQPLHLRHLALVRDVALRGTVSMYIHYSLRNFASLVNEGQVSWEAVKFSREGKGVAKVPPVDAIPQIDAYGFPADERPSNLLNDGDATLKSCLEAVRPSDYTLTTFDPVIIKRRNGSYGVSFRGKELSGKSQKALGLLGLEASSPAAEGESPRGVSYQGRKRKETAADVDEEFAEEAEVVRSSKRRQKAEEFVDPYAGMTEKEKLEAQGFDESWTEYSVLLLERPGPGIFLTPTGRRRPIGKARGRPGRSRIAIIKLEKLKKFDWFVNEQDTEIPPAGDGDQGQASAAISNAESIADQSTSQTQQRTTTTQLTDSSKLAEDVDLQEVIPLGAQAPVNRPLVSKKRKYVATCENENGKLGTSLTPQPTPKRRGRLVKKNPKVASIDATLQNGDKRFDQDTVAGHTRITGHGSPAPQLSDKRQQALRDVAAEVTQTKAKRGTKRKFVDNVADSEQSASPPTPEIVSSGSGDVGSPSFDLAPVLPSEDIRPVSQLTDSAIHPLSTSQTSEGGKERIPQGQIMQNEIHATDNALNKAGDGSQVVEHEGEGITDTTHEPPFRGASNLNIINIDGNNESRTAQSQTQDIDLRTPEPVLATKGKIKSKKSDTQAGSIAFLRRKIVMDIVEISGGVYPYGTELWYPFTTAWFKTKQTGRPDFRTLRTTVKYMTESGKLRQLTFSGRNSKGLVVTKSIIAKPEIAATDSVVMDLQRAMLEADPQQYFPPGPEINPSLRKSHRIVQIPEKRLPEIEEQVTVTLHQVPVRARPPELKPPRVQRPRSGPVERLKSTMRRSPSHSALNWLTSPNSGIAEGVPRPLEYVFRDPILSGGSITDLELSVPRRHLPPRSKPPPYATILQSIQSFHRPTGTFGTLFDNRLWRGPPGIKPRLGQMAPSLPTTLEDILSMTKKRPFDISNNPDPVSTRVFSEIDAVGRWESKHPEVFDLEKDGWTYINHRIPGPFESAPQEGPIRFEPSELSRVSKERSMPISEAPLRSLASASARVTQEEQPNDHLPSFRGQKRPEGPVNRRLEQFQESKTEKRIPKAVGPTSRRTKLIKVLSSDIVQKVTVAIVVVRVLAGGMEGKMIDWQLVTLAFPNHDPKFIRDRGKAILSRNRLQMSKMQGDFQDRFAEAYERDQVPPIDYGDLTSYDWQWIVDWACTQLEGPRTDTLPSLPATRQQFDSLFDIRQEPIQTLDELYQHNAPATIPRKQALLTGTSFVIPVSQTKMKWEHSSTERLNIAKTWVRANVITPEESYNPADARRILECLGEELIGQAIQSLITERVISMGNRGRITPGRNYDVTEHFVHTFGRKRAIEATQLKRALTFKTTILDTQLHLEKKCAVNYDAEDGDILVLINLFAEGRITIWPVDPPKDKYGLTDGGYLTRLMDKGKLRFDIQVLPVPDRYIYGNPVNLPKTIPRGDMPPDFPPPTGPPPLCKIPLWFDIHGNLVKMLWDMAVAGVVGYLASRPGLTTADIGRLFQPHIADWEVALVLEWMEEAGVVERLGGLSGWAVKEWWWMIIQN
ncbi:hypothetical protein PAAG_06619 [Paracoccidioides lutzii Pb01]|uniref:Uncharacterized protein n=1 Tax=Paracoccidioides lutzii (strain ATCC MYA-826 / Pb01) TaxID=502779 RepID=C1H778_PARBA|nr:hypothetical protein PAAG_06619 [Paracoccidioides lutzii Pb01]EEH35572.2 hypothetical protein PAAG_06619 [Paracoccidioides lutzii Pb01]